MSLLKQKYEGREPVRVTAWQSEFTTVLYMPWGQYQEAIFHSKISRKAGKDELWFNGSVAELRQWEYKYAQDAFLR